MEARAFTIPHPRSPKINLWRVVVERPEADGGTFHHDFKGNDAVFCAAQMQRRWQLRDGKRERFTYKHPTPEDWSAPLAKLRQQKGRDQPGP